VADTLQIIGAVRGAGVTASDYEIAVSILPALKSYMRLIAMGDDDSKRNLIFQDFTVALTTGTGSLTTAFAASQPLIASSEKCWNVLVVGETAYSSWLPDVMSLQMGRSRLLSYFCIDGSVLRTRDRTGSLTGFTAVNATVSGPAVLSITNLPSQLFDEYIGVLAGMLPGKEMRNA
jgi:hypothetical protein